MRHKDASKRSSFCFFTTFSMEKSMIIEDSISQTNFLNCNTPNLSHFLQETIHNDHHHSTQLLSNWEDLSLCCHQNMQHIEMQPNILPTHMLDNPYPPNPTPDLLNMLPLPKFSPPSLLPTSSSFLTSLGLFGDLSSIGDGIASPTSIVYDPLLPLSLPPQPPFLRELIPSLPNGYNLEVSMGGGSLSSGVVDHGDGFGGAILHDGESWNCENGIFEFNGKCEAKGRKRKGRKPFVNEKQRRVQLNGKYDILKNLVPNPTKSDRASVVAYAIEYINDLKRTVAELEILVEKKRCIKNRLKRHKLEEISVDGAILKAEDGVEQKPLDGSTLRSSWLHRKSKNIEVDVRIIDDEVVVKLVQQKRINCLTIVSKVLDELLLDLHHAAGGTVGDYYSYLFNCKIWEGSKVYAHAIANKLIEAVDNQYAAVLPTINY